MSKLTILFEDRDLLAVSKPGGLATQAPIQFDSLEKRVRTYLSDESDDEKPYLGIPHRLDRCVSGSIVFAKRRKAAQRLSSQFEHRTVRKQYRALVLGSLEPAHGEWKDYLRKIPNEPRGEVVPTDRLADCPDAKLAVMSYDVVGSVGEFTDLRIQLETGRMHQIRLQASARNHPIVGDRMYGSTVDFGHPPDCERNRHIALHAFKLVVDHPRSRQPLTITSPLPRNWPGEPSA